MQVDSTEFYCAFPAVVVEKSLNFAVEGRNWEFRRCVGIADTLALVSQIIDIFAHPSHARHSRAGGCTGNS